MMVLVHKEQVLWGCVVGRLYLRFGLSPVVDQLDPMVDDVEESVDESLSAIKTVILSTREPLVPHGFSLI